MSELTWPTQTAVAVRQADLGRDGKVSTLGVARWLEDARLRLPLRRFELLVANGKVEPFRILLVGQQVERLRPCRRPGDEIEVLTGVGRIGRTSFTYLHEVREDGGVVGTGEATIVLGGSQGPLSLPDDLVADLRELQVSGEITDRVSEDQGTREHYQWWMPVRTRIADLDSNHHVNFQVLLTWYEDAVAEFVLAAGGAEHAAPSPRLATSRLRIEYTGEVTYPGDYEVGVSVTAVEDGAIRYDLAIFRGDRCLGTAQARAASGELDPDVFARARLAR